MAKSRNPLPIYIATKIAVIDAVEAGDRSKSEVAKSFNNYTKEYTVNHLEEQGQTT